VRKTLNLMTGGCLAKDSQLKSIECRTSGERGLGVFALRAFKKGDLIERSPGIMLGERDTAILSITALSAYIFGTSAGSILGLGLTSIYNHSDRPTAKVSRFRRFIFVRALRDIKVGEEITLDYGWSQAVKDRNGVNGG
jgi:SET domain-containing protein